MPMVTIEEVQAKLPEPVHKLLQGEELVITLSPSPSALDAAVLLLKAARKNRV